MWRSQYVQSMVEHKAHRLRMRISRICAWETSRLAYDGSRYYIREILKSLPARERLVLEAKVPQVTKRSTCTLSTLINLNAELRSLVA